MATQIQASGTREKRSKLYSISTNFLSSHRFASETAGLAFVCLFTPFQTLLVSSMKNGPWSDPHHSVIFTTSLQNHSQCWSRSERHRQIQLKLQQSREEWKRNNLARRPSRSCHTCFRTKRSPTETCQRNLFSVIIRILLSLTSESLQPIGYYAYENTFSRSGFPLSHVVKAP